MCADGAKAPGQRFAYNHAFDALLRIGREEGLGTFSRGLGPNIVRSVIMSKLMPSSPSLFGFHPPNEPGKVFFSSSDTNQMYHRLPRKLVP